MTGVKVFFAMTNISRKKNDLILIVLLIKYHVGGWGLRLEVGLGRSEGWKVGSGKPEGGNPQKSHQNG